MSKEYRSICKQVKMEIKKARIEFEKNLVEKAKTNPKLLFKYLNSQQNVKDSIKALKDANGEITHQPIEIANLLNKSFQDVFVKEEGTQLPPFGVKFDNGYAKFEDLDPDDIKYEQVLFKLKNLDQYKTCGADKMHPLILRNCAEAFALPITLIFRSSLANSQLPIQFRSANVTPL